MGIPAPSGVGASGTPPTGDQANAVVSGQFAAIGPGAWFAIYGGFNVTLWATTIATLTTTAGSLAASVNSATGLAVGQGINSVNVPPGTTIGALSGTNVTLALPPGATLAQVLTGVDAAAQFTGGIWGGSVQLERSFDGGSIPIICGVGGSGTGAIYSGATLNGQALSIVVNEPEKGVLYRLNCTALSSGKPFYRISTTGILGTVRGGVASSS